jgi:hypothetical protein
MVQQNIVSYILFQLKQGKSLEELNKFLLSAGYDSSEVESSVQYVLNLQSNPKLAEEQRIQQLVEYIKKQVSAGYDYQTIANFLLSRGYPYYEVNSAMQSTVAPRKPVFSEHKIFALALVAMFVMTSAVILIFIKSYFNIDFGIPEQLLDVEAERLTTVVKQGSDFSFQVKLINFGYEKRFDVVLNYKIIARETQTVVLEKSETVALSTTLENIVKFEIPDVMKTGSYVLRVDAVYGDFTATAGFIFDVLPKELAEEQLKEMLKKIPDIKNVTEIPELSEDGAAKQVEKIPAQETKSKPFYEGKTKKEAFELVKTVSVREPERALEMCNEFRLSSIRESCVLNIASFKNIPSLCDSIQSQRDKDACYLQLAIKSKDTTACAKIIDSNVKQSCQLASTTKQLQSSPKQQSPKEIYDKMAPFLLKATPAQQS